MFRVLIRVAATVAALAFVAPAAMAAHNTYDGYKSSYPQLHQLALVSGEAGNAYGDYKSSYPQLHAVLSHRVAAPIVLTRGGGFDWRNAGLGALVGALGAAVVAAAIRQLSRRRITALR